MSKLRARAVGRRGLLLIGCAMGALSAAPALAQPSRTTAPAEAEFDEDAEVDELVVTAARQLPGAVVGDIPAEVTLGPAEIRSLGASSVAELLEALEPQTGSSRGRGGGRPVTLVNGGRISSFSEIRDLPPEAILRVEVFPEELALKYGYRADQRVVNFILRPRFRAITTEVGARVPTAGGRESVDANLNIMRIQRDTRMQLDIKASHAEPLTEAERDIIRGGGAPFDPLGNVTSVPFGTEIDPALSALAGQTVTVAGVPTGGAAGLGGFAGLAGGRSTDVGRFRTLRPATDSLSINGILTRPVAEGVNATLNGEITFNQSEAQLGLPGSTLIAPAGSLFSPFSRDVAVHRYAGLDPLTRLGESLNAHLGLSVNGARSGWRWSFNGNADRTDTESITERGVDVEALQAAVRAGAVDPFAGALVLFRAPDFAHSVLTSADAELLLNGRLFELPAGGVNAAFTVGAETRQVESKSFRRGETRYADLGRDLGRVQGNIDIPLASRRNNVLAGLGNLSLNFNAELNQLSDFGTLRTLGAGVNWSPIEPVRIIASFTDEEGAPTIQQLGDPEIFTPGVRVFDFRRGETVEVTQISGGNPALTADNRRVFKLGLTMRPLGETDFVLRTDYVSSRIRNVIAEFPTPTPEIEEAFDDRFLRDDQGRLLQIDVRPVNFARQDRDELRWGFNYSRRLRGTRTPPFPFPGGPSAQGGQAARSPAPTPGQPGATGQRPAEGGPAAGGGRRGQGAGGFGPGGGFSGGGFGPGGRGGGGGFGAGSIQLSVFHTWRFKDEVEIRPGVPILDFLNGSAAGSGGGSPQHQIEAQAAVSRNGLGARVNARWRSATEVRGGPLGAQDLFFSDLTTVNVRLFADLGLQPWARNNPFLLGARATLSIDNVFDARPEVRTATGTTPLSYQPDLLDPLGRTVRVTFRKAFFSRPPGGFRRGAGDVNSRR